MSQKKGKLNTAQLSYLEELERNNQRMIHLVADLLTVSRLELGKTSRKFEHVDFDELLETLIKKCSRLLRKTYPTRPSNIDTPEFKIVTKVS